MVTVPSAWPLLGAAAGKRSGEGSGRSVLRGGPSTGLELLGAFVAAMLYDTVGPALLATLESDQFQSTLALNVNFLRPVRPGRLVGKGRVVHRDGDMAFLEASLYDSRGTLIATAAATARVIPFTRARFAA
jgi:acyl-coenzyme A thioesterase PaaI-like protein